MPSKFEEIALNIAKVLEEKNKAYGAAFDKSTQILQLLYPNGIPLESYPDVHVIVRVLDKLSRIAQNKDPFGESPWLDITGYGILAQIQHDNIKQSKKDNKDV